MEFRIRNVFKKLAKEMNKHNDSIQTCGQCILLNPTLFEKKKLDLFYVRDFQDPEKYGFIIFTFYDY